MSKPVRSSFALTPASPVLISESAQEFKALRESLDQEIQPQGIVEQMYVADIAHLVWEIERLRRCKAAIISSKFRSALEGLLARLMREPGDVYGYDTEEEAEKLAEQWFAKEAAKKQVADVLKKFQLDESAIEGEVIRKSLGAIAQLDSLLASLESRRNKAVRLLVEWRGGLARQRGGSADRNFPALEHAANEKLAA